MNRTVRFLLTVLVLPPLGVSNAARAQSPLTLSVEPRAGFMSPDGYLYERYTNFSGDGPVEWSDGYLGHAPVLGVGIEIGRAGGSLMLRGEVLRSFGQRLSVSHSVVMPRELYTPPYVSTTWLDAPAAVTLTSLQLVVPTRVTVWRIQPYVLGGVGGKRYDFGTPAGADTTSAILPADGFTWTAVLGAGLEVPLPWLTLDLQARSALNHYWSKPEHDLVFSGGVLWRLR
jgi:hypothetical protein